LAAIKPVVEKHNPSSAFDYRFTDEEFEKKFSQANQMGKLARIFTVLSVLISCLGMFGLASFMAERRTKEIGIRKVMGASHLQLWKMLSKDFVVLVIISCTIAIPTGYYLMNSWLQNYEYRTDISWWIFLVTGSGALVITLLTVSFQTVKATLVNPVKSLKTE
ncbi:MAG TPA: FtsX-like permease family protein, partial [Chryseolinea sp.]|nr:FtsX-like permease family protein [Chryseolinea sp.]